jgi:hypothetical protein
MKNIKRKFLDREMNETFAYLKVRIVREKFQLESSVTIAYIQAIY